MAEPDQAKSRATRGGPYILAVTGFAIIALMARAGGSVGDMIMLGLVGMLLLWGSFRLALFVREQGEEIGEARFDTRNKD